MMEPDVSKRWHEYNDWTRACRILGELGAAIVGAYAAYMISGNLWIAAYDAVTGKMMFCENGYPNKCGLQVMIASVPQLVLLFFAGIYFASRPLSDFQTILRVIARRVVPAVVILSAVFTTLWLLPDHLRYVPWHLPGLVCATLALLLVMTGWRRLWVRTR